MAHLAVPADLRYRLEAPLRCGRCGEDYIERENLGQWRCHGHVGEVNLGGPGHRHAADHWECCGAAHTPYQQRFGGCIAMDHTTRGPHAPYTSADDTFLSAEWLVLFHPQPRLEAVLTRTEVLERWGNSSAVAEAGVEMDANDADTLDIDSPLPLSGPPPPHRGPSGSGNGLALDEMTVVRRFDWRNAPPN